MCTATSFDCQISPILLLGENKAPPLPPIEVMANQVEPRIAAVALIRVSGRVVLVRRTVWPQIGTLVLPGGFKELGESEPEAAARELFEEAGMFFDPKNLTYLWEFRVKEAPIIVKFYIGNWDFERDGEIPTFVPTDESSERAIVSLSELPALGFSSHAEAIMRAFDCKG